MTKTVHSADPCQRPYASRHFNLICSSLVLTKLGDLLASPKLVLTWLLGSAGVSPAIISLLVPIRESGSLIPQLAIGNWVSRFARRSWLWQWGSFCQGLCVALMALTLQLGSGDAAGLAVLGLLALFSLARGLCSVTIKDLQGKLIKRSQRGRLSGFATSIAGGLTLLVSLYFFAPTSAPQQPVYLWLLVIAALLWLGACALFVGLNEADGETRHAANSTGLIQRAAELLTTDKVFRHFVVSRALLMGSALAGPFLLLLAQQQHHGAHTFALFLLASAMASSLSATVWGLMADTSSRRVMMLGGTLAGSCCLAVWTCQWQTQGLSDWLYALFYLLLMMAHEGVRIGRQTYLVNMAEGVKRTDYVSLSNSVIGVLLLLAGALTAALATWSVTSTVLVLGLLTLGGAFSTWRMSEVE
ncbi:MFS transporter [Bowmanella denitrificans]|uniref:MFS transporter n=1 Tax=Bowmanella denitrificans TaxID=366582 RepID=UPI000C99B60B|nr:MFS transporter [Bowmanella denitrificans]